MIPVDGGNRELDLAVSGSRLANPAAIVAIFLRYDLDDRPNDDFRTKHEPFVEFEVRIRRHSISDHSLAQEISLERFERAHDSYYESIAPERVLRFIGMIQKGVIISPSQRLCEFGVVEVERILLSIRSGFRHAYLLTGFKVLC